MPRTVLIAEDEPLLREPLRRRLEQEGWAVQAASDGAEAVALLEQSRPDVVLLDLVMPKVDGPGVLEQLRKRYPDLPVIIITNLSQDLAAEKCARLGVQQIVVKSNTTLRYLAERVRECLGA